MSAGVEKFYRCGICSKRVGLKSATCDCCKWYVHYACSKTSYKKVCELKKSSSFICTKCLESTGAETCGHCTLLATSRCNDAQSKSMEMVDTEGDKAPTANGIALRCMDAEELGGDAPTVRSTEETTRDSPSASMEVEEVERGATGDEPSAAMGVEDTVHTFEDDLEERLSFTLGIMKDKEQQILSPSLEILPQVPKVQTNVRLEDRSRNNGSLKRRKSQFHLKRFQVKRKKIVDRRYLELSSNDERDSADNMSLSCGTSDEAESEGTEGTPYEYFNESGKAVGTVEIVKTSPDEIVHGRPLAQDEKKVVVKKVYPQGSTEDDEFVEGAFLRVNKVQLRKLQKKVRKVRKVKKVMKVKKVKKVKSSNMKGVRPLSNPGDHGNSSNGSSDEAEPEGTMLDAPYEFFNESGKAIGTVEIVKTSPDEMVHGRPLAQDEKKVVVKKVYSQGSTEDDEFVEGAFLRVNKVQLRKLAYKKKSTSKKKGRGHKVGSSPRKWEKEERKKARNSGEAYISTSGKPVPRKTLDTQFRCECKHTQCKEVTEDIRKVENTAFWNLGDLEAQSHFLLSKIITQEKKSAKKTAQGKVSKPKGKTRIYTITGHRVCKELFKVVYNQSNGRLGRLLKFSDSNPGTVKKDGRGGKTKEVNPIIGEKIIHVLKKLPKYVSHYELAKNPDDNNVFLEPGLTWSKVYELVKDEVGDAVEEKDFPSNSWFFDKVRTQFPHVKVHTPTKDKCNTCSVLTLQDKLVEREKHQERATAFREQMKKDKGDNCIQFDLQQVQPLPFIKENKSFYNRKTWLYNFGVNINDKPYFFLWTEVTASRGAREIASCLYKLYTEGILDAETVYNQLIEWSDSCGGQNRNFIQVCMRLRLLKENPNIKSLIHRFPISGHSYLACDGDFGDIEKAKKKKDSIYTVEQYEDAMMSSKAKKNKPVIIRMQTEDFHDFVKGINFQNLNKPVDTDGKKFSWLEIHEFRYEQNLFGFKFKYNLGDNYRTCYFGKNEKTRSNRPTKPVFTDMPVLYPNGLKLKAPKVLDMATLMDFVPPVYQDWYKKVIKSHEKVVADYNKKKKKKRTNEEEDDDEPEILF